MTFDSHTHIHFSAYNKDREEVIERARKAGVKMITVGTDYKSSLAAVGIAEKYPDDIWATVGIHPNEAKSAEISNQVQDDEFRKLAKNPRVVAIGECGLDYFRGVNNKELQKEIFIKQIELAKEVNKPLMIHCRASKGTDDAYEDLVQQFLIFNFQLPKISHFFAGSLEIAKQLLELEFYFTFGGVITFSRDYDEIIKFLPLENIMVETDAPYVAPEPYRGKRNEPAYVLEVAKKIAEIKEVTYEEVARQTTKNVEQVFGISL